MFPDETDLETLRTPHEHMQFIRQWHKRLDCDKKSEEDYRLKKDSWKRFREELQPLASVTYAVFGVRPNVKVKLGPPRDPKEPEYDGLIERLYDKDTPTYVQVTLALGQEYLRKDNLRMGELNESGSVPAQGPIWRTKDRKIEYEDCAQDAKDIDDLAEEVIQAIKKKRTKLASYPKPVWLIVVCDDLPPSPLANPDVMNARGEIPRLTLLGKLYSQKVLYGLQFRRVFLFGQNGRFLQELLTSDKAMVVKDK